MTQVHGSRIESVDGLRAVAMTMVIAQHCGLLPFGWVGVWLFYVISGYVITRGFLADDYAGGSISGRWGEFMWRRALRIVPVYLLYVAVNVLILTSMGGASRLGDVPHLLGFTYNWHMIFGFWPGSSGWSPFGHLWTLSVEQQFYLVFPLLVLCCPKRAQVAVTVALIAAGPLVRWWWASTVAADFDEAGQRAFAVYAASLCHFDAFLLGSLLARAEPYLRASPRLGVRLWGVALAVAVAYAASFVLVNLSLGAQGTEALRNVVSGVLWGQGREVLAYIAVDLLAVAMLAHALAGGAGSQWLSRASIVWVGRVSYGGYLFHALVMWLVSQFLEAKVRDEPLLARLALFALVWIVTVAVASASYRWFEAPVARWGRTLRKARPIVLAPVQKGTA